LGPPIEVLRLAGAEITPDSAVIIGTLIDEDQLGETLPAPELPVAPDDGTCPWSDS
jgi:hypothetical protein